MDHTLSFDLEADELEIFLQDVDEHLEAMEAGILRLEQAADAETLNSVFRAAHTLKALASTVGHHQMADLTHTAETLFDAMREAQLSPTSEVADVLFATVDALKALRDEIIRREPSGVDVAALLTRLRALMGSLGEAPGLTTAFGQSGAPAPGAAYPSSGGTPAPPRGPASASGPAPAPPCNGAAADRSLDKTVRISVERLDTLMNLVGELVTDRTRLLQIEGALRGEYGTEGTVGALGEMSAHFGRVVDQLQEEVMRARMLPIAHLFNKLPRLVRDVARAAGKQVNLIIEGEATELDRSIIEAIGDPLIHLLRNAVDHGIESPEERIAAGKAPTGTVRLTAAPVEGQIVITVEDDGRGIDPERVRRAALSRGFFSSEEEAAQLDDSEVIDLIFRPNLSTAETVTEVSGRGVGMDVVRANVERLSGSVVVESEVGHGTTFRVTLPLTLAIVQTMLVAVGRGVYAVPLAGIIDSLYLSEVTVNTVKGHPSIRWRGSVLPLLDMREFFSQPGLTNTCTNGAKPAVVTVAWGKLCAGLMVDSIIGKQEVVVKSFSPLIGKVAGLSGCAILGDGRIALIVDIPGLINAALQTRR